MSEKKVNLFLMYIVSHVFIGFGAAVRSGLTAVPVAIIVVACVIQGVVSALLDGKGVHMYIHKFCAMLVCSLALIPIARAVGQADNIVTMLNIVYLPVVTGAMLVEQTYGFKTPQGRRGMVRAMICFLSVALAYSISLTLRRIAYV